MIEKINLNNILFIDIETVPLFPNLESAPEPIQKLWKKKALVDQVRMQVLSVQL